MATTAIKVYWDLVNLARGQSLLTCKCNDKIELGNLQAVMFEGDCKNVCHL